ncbi:MAG: nitroreductase family protein [Marinifilaceae bacterium]|jgi:Fe-S-cluster-containing hydrogenase component 2|nr:nitroreductase family protein [Marinifilaceae bacterium]
MVDFKIDQEKCISCGICANDCPMRIIDMDQYPSLTLENEPKCIQCQHCMAACPVSALSIVGKNPEESEKTLDLPDSKLVDNMIKTRRSTRNYKDEILDKNLINEMLKTASYAPTGHNDNGVRFTATYDKESMSKFKEMIYSSIKSAKEEGKLAPEMNFLYQLQQIWENTGQDRIFWDAPHIVIASSSNKNVTPIEDSIIALSYFELLANSNNIGTLWNGMIKWTMEAIDPSLIKKIGIPEDHKIGYIMLFGKTNIKYPRAIQSNGIDIHSFTIS